MLRVKYLNINGLTKYKLESLQNTLEDADVMFLAETWHCATKETIEHPMFVGKTPIIERRLNSRQGNGMAVFVNRFLRQNIEVTRMNEYYITIRYINTSISAVYLPPSLDENTFAGILDNIADSDVIVGDINVAFGAAFGCGMSGPPARRSIIDRLIIRHRFEHLRPISGTAKWDHVLSKIPAFFHIKDTPVPSDHPMIDAGLDVDTQGPRLHIDENPTRRYHLRKLAEADAATALRESYRGISYDFVNMARQLETDLPRLSVEQRCRRLDALEQKLVDYVQLAAESSLGSYSVNAQKKQPDVALDRLAEAKSHHAAIQMFKRGCRCASTTLASSDPTKTLEEEVADHFGRVYAPPALVVKKNPVRPAHAGMFDEKLKLSDDTLDAFGIGDRDWIRHFNADAVRAFITRYDASKACGPDSIHIKILKTLVYGPLEMHLAMLFQLCALTGITPSRWNQSIVYPLKKKPDAAFIAECRPIALTAMFRRAFEAILQWSIMARQDCSELRQFHATQAGFREGHSTLLHAAFSNDLATLRPRPDRVFIDFKQAYDRVPLDLLVKKLQQRNTPAVVMSLIISMFSRCSIRVAINGQQSRSIDLCTGLFQGSLLAPFLFLVFIDDLALALSVDSTPAIPNALLFADDLELQGVGDRLQSLCNIVTEWADANCMTVGIAKCGHLGPEELVLYVQRQPIPHVNRYPYLGFPHELSGINFGAHIANMEAKARKILNACMVVGNSWPEWVKLAIYKTFIRSRLEYGGQLMVHHRDKITPLQTLQEDALKWIIPYSPHTLSTAAVTAIVPIDLRFEALAVTFTLHCTNMAEDHPARRFCVEVCGSGPWSSTLLIPRAVTLGLTKMLTDLAAESEISLHTMIRKYTLEMLERRSTIARYISTSSRRNTYGPDKTLYWTDKEMRQTALAWRVGSFGCRHYCPAGGHRFNRRCVTHCLPELEEGMGNLPRLARPLDPPPLYCFIDDLLNLGEEERAGHCLAQLLQTLV